MCRQGIIAGFTGGTGTTRRILELVVPTEAEPSRMGQGMGWPRSPFAEVARKA